MVRLRLRRPVRNEGLRRRHTGITAKQRVRMQALLATGLGLVRIGLTRLREGNATALARKIIALGMLCICRRVQLGSIPDEPPVAVRRCARTIEVRLRCDTFVG